MEHDRDNVIEFDRGNNRAPKRASPKGKRTKQGKAIQGIRVAANAGNSDGQYALGMFFRNRGPDQDLQEAAVWLKRAARQGHPEAQFELAGMYKLGQGVRRNRVLAMKWFLLASAAGDEDAQIHSEIMGSKLTAIQGKRALVMAVRFRLKIEMERTMQEMMNSPSLYPPNNQEG